MSVNVAKCWMGVVFFLVFAMVCLRVCGQVKSERSDAKKPLALHKRRLFFPLTRPTSERTMDAERSKY